MPASDRQTVVVGSAAFGDAGEPARVLVNLLVDVAATDVGFGAGDVVYVAGPDGTVCHDAKLVRERLTNGSLVFNVVLG